MSSNSSSRAVTKETLKLRNRKSARRLWKLNSAKLEPSGWQESKRSSKYHSHRSPLSIRLTFLEPAIFLNSVVFLTNELDASVIQVPRIQHLITIVSRNSRLQATYVGLGKKSFSSNL